MTAGMSIGVNEHMDWAFQADPAVRHRILDDMAAIGFTSVRLDYAWGSIQPEGPDEWDWDELDTYISEAHDRGLTVLVMLYWPPAWSSPGGKNGVPGDYADYGRVLGEIGARYGVKLAGIEMWNEPDLDGFWEGSAQQYAAMLAEAYPVAKGLSPDTTFLAAAPTYLGLATGWFEAMYATGTYGPGRSYDAQAIHPYMSPSDLPPNAPASDWSIHGISALQQLREWHGDISPLWATELGWSTHDNASYPDPIPNHKRGVSEVEQAAYTLGALILLDRYGVAAAYLYTDVDMPGDDAQEASFGMLRADLTSKPVVDLLTAVLHAGPPEPPDPEPEPGGDLEQRVAALEEAVVNLVDTNASVAGHLRAAADDLAPPGAP